MYVIRLGGISSEDVKFALDGVSWVTARQTFRAIVIGARIPLAIAIGCLTLLSPAFDTGWFGDDTVNSVIPGSLARESFWELVRGLYYSGLHGGVRRPGLDLETIAVFAVFTDRFAYKLLLVLLTLVALELARRCYARWWGEPFANAAALCTALCFQIRAYHDPFIAYNGVQQLVAIGIFGSIELFSRWLETGSRKFLIGSITAYVLAASCYETVYLLCVLYLIVASWKRPFADALRKAAAFLAIGAVLCATELKTLLSVQVEGAAGYAVSSNIFFFSRALVDQLCAALPLVYPLSEAIGRGWVPALVVGLPGAFAAVIFVLFFAGLTAAIWRPVRSHAPPEAGEALPFGIALWILPALLIALSAKYQHELHLGIGYLPVLIEYFGAGLVFATLLARLTSGRSRFAFLSVVVAVFPIFALVTFASNRVVAIDIRSPYLSSREAFVTALKRGLLDGVGPDGSVGIVAQLPWVVQGGETLSDLIWEVTKRRITVVPEPGVATTVVEFDAPHESWSLSEHPRDIASWAGSSCDATQQPGLQAFPTRLADIAVGGRAFAWGLDPSGNIFRFNAGSNAFEQIPGRLATISVATDGTTWGLNEAGGVFRYDGDRAFHQVPGLLSVLSVGSSRSIWGLNRRGYIYRFDDRRGIFSSMPGLLSSISVGSDGDVWGLNRSGGIYHFDGRSRFESIPGSLAYLQVADRRRVWGINARGFIFKYDESRHGFTNVGGRLSTLSVGSDGAVWGVNPKNSVYRYDAGTFREVPLQLSRIVVADRACAWGIGPRGETYRVAMQKP